jgi:hypothetical protein
MSGGFFFIFKILKICIENKSSNQNQLHLIGSILLAQMLKRAKKK